MTRLPANQFIEAWSSDDAVVCAQSWQEYVVNPIGSILLGIARPDFSRYAARLHDLNGLITLVNAKRAIRQAGLSVDQVAEFLHDNQNQYADPYRGQALQWQRETSTLGFFNPVPGSGYNELPLPLVR